MSRRGFYLRIVVLYNARVLNHYTTAQMRRDEQARYEKTYRKYRGTPQLKATAVDTAVDLDPYQRSMHATAIYTLQSKTAVPIAAIHLSDNYEFEQTVSFDRPATHILEDPRHLYSVWQFSTPVRPGDVVKMTARCNTIPAAFATAMNPPSSP